MAKEEQQAVEMSDVAGAPPAKASSPKWVNFLARHVRIHSQLVSKTLRGTDLGQAREHVLNFLDGYLLWLSPTQRSNFKISFYVSTTWVPPGTSPDPALDAALTAARAVTDTNQTTKHFASTLWPKDAEEARRHLEAYLVLWRSVFTLGETASHAANRIAQIFDWEVTNNGPLCKLARFHAWPRIEVGLSDLDDSDSPDYADLDISVTEEDVIGFYQDGLKAMERRKLNLDDLHDLSDFRIKPSRCEKDNPTGFLPKMSQKRTLQTHPSFPVIQAQKKDFLGFFMAAVFSPFLSVGLFFPLSKKLSPFLSLKPPLLTLYLLYLLSSCSFDPNLKAFARLLWSQRASKLESLLPAISSRLSTSTFGLRSLHGLGSILVK